MKLDMATIKLLEAHHIGFVSYIDAPWGADTVALSAEDIPLIVQDRAQFGAKHHGVSKHDFLRWVETGGAPQCGATTKGGTRCKNLVSGGIQRSIAEWLELDGQLCAVHGGESADQARPGR